MSEDWKKLIVSMFYVKQELMKYDKGKIWSHHLLNKAANEEQIKHVENNLGYTLNSGYRSFLKFANGWKGFLQTIDLLGTNELLDSTIMNYANEMLDEIESHVIKPLGLLRKDLLPIAISLEDKDIFVITSPKSNRPGQVIWFAGEEIDYFTDFKEFFLSMIEYYKLEIKNLRK